MTASLDPRNARAYRKRASLSFGLGCAGVIVAGAGLLKPDAIATSSVGVALSQGFALIWLGTYFLGGLLLIAGVQWRPIPRPELEAFGLWLLTGTMLLNGLVVIAIRGPVAGGITTAGLWAIAYALLQRLSELHVAAETERRARDQAVELDRRSDPHDYPPAPHERRR